MIRLFLPLLLAVASQAHAVEFSALELKQIESLSGQQINPLPDPSNRVSGNPEAIAVGEKLFFDKRLSPDGKVSCASCHQADKGFADGLPLSDLRGKHLKRHTPSLWNVALNRWYFWDGRSDSLWAQATQSLESTHEMASNRVYLAGLVINDLLLNDSYTRLFGKIPACLTESPLPDSGRPSTTDPQLQADWDGLSSCQQEGVNQVFTGLTKMLAAYEETLLAKNSRFDQFAQELKQQGVSEKLNEQQQQGLKLFMSKARCLSCHSGPNFSDSEFHSVFINGGGEAGRYAIIPSLLDDPFNQRGDYSDSKKAKSSKLDYLYRSVELRHKFKTPGLRNLSATAPYMHDGSMASLKEVLVYYAGLASQIEKGRHEETMLNGLSLNNLEIDALQAFLLALNDEPPGGQQ